MEFQSIILQKLHERNARDCSNPELYRKNAQLFNENLRLNTVLTSTQLYLNEIQYDIGRKLSTSEVDKNEISGSITNKINKCQHDIKDPHIVKKLFDNRKLVLAKEEELKLAKSELISHMNKNAELSIALEASTMQVDELQKKVNILETENLNLINRILIEKNKNIEEINVMNELLDSDKKSSAK